MKWTIHNGSHLPIISLETNNLEIDEAKGQKPCDKNDFL